MKKAIIFSMMLIISAFTFCQQPPSVKTDYLQKSKKQKKTAWILLGGGAALFVTGVVIPRGDLTDQFDIYTLSHNIYENDGIKAGFIVTGTLSMLGSVPFFIISGKNKRRAATVSFKNEKVLRLSRASFIYRQVPSLNFKISL